MAAYILFIRNNGAPATGLTPVFITLKKVSDSSNYLPIPVISEIGGGLYKYDAAPSEHLVGVVDAGATILNNTERYLDQNIPVGGPVSALGSHAITVNVMDTLNSIPIPDCEMVILNSSESIIVNSGLTDSNGNLSLQLNLGNYIIRLRKDGYNFTVPQSLVVIGPGTVNYIGTNVGDIQADFRTVVVPKDTQF